MSETTNSAKRLYEILEELYEALKKAQNHRSPNMSASYFWSKALGVKGNIEKDLPDKFSTFICIFRDVEEDIKRIQFNPKSQRIYIDAISRLKSDIFTTGLSKDPQSWKLLYKLINQEILDIVDLCSEEIAEKGTNYNSLLPKEYNKFTQKLRELVDDFTNSDLPVDLKTKLIGDLRKIEKALIDIKIRGEGNLSNVTEEIIGRSFLKSLKNRGKYGESFLKIMSFAHQINGSINLGEKIASLPEAIQKLLPPG